MRITIMKNNGLKNVYSIDENNFVEVKYERKNKVSYTESKIWTERTLDKFLTKTKNLNRTIEA